MFSSDAFIILVQLILFTNFFCDFCFIAESESRNSSWSLSAMYPEYFWYSSVRPYDVDCGDGGSVGIFLHCLHQLLNGKYIQLLF